MQSWSDLPTEILNLITTYCGRDCTQVKWMFVNKRWFTFYLSQAYFTIRISLGNEAIINKILHSPFNVGKYVKHINLFNLQKPKNLNELDVHNDLLGKIMKRTPNVHKVYFSRNAAGSDQNSINQDWFYLSMVLINLNCWKLQFLPTLGENDLVSSAYYYTCAYYSRRTLKKLEISVGMLSSQDINCLKEFTALETLEVHKKLIGGLEDLGSLLQFTPKLQELTVRFASDRVCKPTKKEYKRCSSIKKLCLCNFTPQNNGELLTLVNEFSGLENLLIFGEKHKIWLGNIEDALTTDSFFRSINSIAKYKIMMSGDTEEIGFYEPWLKSISSSRQDILLLHSYSEGKNQSHLNFKSNAVATFYGGLTQHIPLLKYAMMVSQTAQNISDKLRAMDGQNISRLRIIGVGSGLNATLSVIIAEERNCLKQIDIFNCTLDAYTPLASTALVPQHIKHIIFQNCKIDLFPLKLFINEFKSLDYVEFDNCTVDRDADVKSIDMSNTDIKSLKISRFQKMSPENTYTNTVQTVVVISVYFATQDFTKYFTIVDDILIEATKRTFELFCSKFSSNEAVVLNIKVGSLQELSLKLTKTSKIKNISFSSLA